MKETNKLHRDIHEEKLVIEHYTDTASCDSVNKTWYPTFQLRWSKKKSFSGVLGNVKTFEIPTLEQLWKSSDDEYEWRKVPQEETELPIYENAKKND